MNPLFKPLSRFVSLVNILMMFIIGQFIFQALFSFIQICLMFFGGRIL